MPVPLNSCRILLSNYETAVPSMISDTEIVAFFRNHLLGDGFCCWLDHMRGTQDPPEPLPGEDLVVTFWPNNPYNPRRARQRGISLNEYNELRIRQCLKYRAAIGNRFQCCMGWETFEPRHLCNADRTDLMFQTYDEAFTFFCDWVRTSTQNLHWRDSKKFSADYPQTRHIEGLLGFIDKKGILPEQLNVMVGNRNPVMAHPSFEAVPEAGAFWWECLHTAASGMQIGMPFVRGAAQQYGKKWLCDVAPYSGPAPVYPDEYYEDMGEWNEMEGALSGNAKPRMNHPRYTQEMVRLAGYSVEMTLRCWITALLGGCDWLFQEASSVTHIIKRPDGKLQLTPYGRAAKQLAVFNRRLADRGTPWTPVTLLVDAYHGTEPHQVRYKPWGGHMEHTPGTRQIIAFFDAAYPGHGDVRLSEKPYGSPEEHAQMLLSGRDMRDTEQNHLVAGRWADMFDVLTTQTPDEPLEDSKVLFLLGPQSEKRLDTEKLRAWVEQGRTLIATAGTLASPPDYFPQIEGESVTRNGWADEHGGVQKSAEYDYCPLVGQPKEVLSRTEKGEPLVTRSRLGRGSLVFVSVPAGLDKEHRLVEPLLRVLDDLCDELFPFEIDGPPLQRACTTIRNGHLLLLVNHGGQDWHGEVTIRNSAVASACELWRETDLPIRETSPGCTIVQPVVPAYGFAVLEITYRGEG